MRWTAYVRDMYGKPHESPEERALAAFCPIPVGDIARKALGRQRLAMRSILG